MTLVIPAYAKLNLCLEVLRRRPDGYHDLASVVCALDWHDLVSVALRRGAAGAVDLTVTGSERDGVPDGADNLAARAAANLAALSGSSHGFSVRLEKRIPAAAGLGGGSADAAAVLRAGAALLGRRGHRIPSAALDDLAEQLGSDVPASLRGGFLLVAGRGEQLRRLRAPSLHLAVAVVGRSGTGAAYAALAADEKRPDGRADRLAERLASGAIPEESQCGSALEPAAARAAPGLAQGLARLRAAVPESAWPLTGSGGAAFALAADAAAAAALARRAQGAGFSARACRTIPAELYEPPG
jgi:4-diphosphocytidyl-2-C-methyl-D-erythritol kinase